MQRRKMKRGDPELQEKVAQMKAGLATARKQQKRAKIKMRVIGQMDACIPLLLLLLLARVTYQALQGAPNLSGTSLGEPLQFFLCVQPARATAAPRTPRALHAAPTCCVRCCCHCRLFGLLCAVRALVVFNFFPRR